MPEGGFHEDAEQERAGKQPRFDVQEVFIRLKAMESDEAAQSVRTAENWEKILTALNSNACMPEGVEASLLIKLLFTIRNHLDSELHLNILKAYVESIGEYPGSTELYVWISMTWGTHATIGKLVMEGLKEWQEDIDAVMETMDVDAKE